MTSIVDLTRSSFEAVVGARGVVIVDWWASWCGPCHSFAVVFADAAARHPSTRFARVDTEAEPDLATAARIQTVPTLMGFRDGQLVATHPGPLDGAAIDRFIEYLWHPPVDDRPDQPVDRGDG